MIGSDPQLFSDLFKNNANLSDGPERRRNHNYFLEMTPVEGMYDCMMYVGKSWSPAWSEWSSNAAKIGKYI